ncbi:hypothetical protein [Streptomyces cellostaticus]|uniref:hypothetical protein n=1 Tax=Streptomyces cellostaticus TaxID=67285 RepID=UPI0020265390|nr:hypothetical protein [Streptomyces cellostaticus]
MGSNHQRRRADRVDVIIFLSILAAGVVLTVLGVPAGSIAGIAAALAALYEAWTAPHVRQSPPNDGSTDAGARPADDSDLL